MNSRLACYLAGEPPTAGRAEAGAEFDDHADRQRIGRAAQKNRIEVDGRRRGVPGQCRRASLAASIDDGRDVPTARGASNRRPELAAEGDGLARRPDGGHRVVQLRLTDPPPPPVFDRPDGWVLVQESVAVNGVQQDVVAPAYGTAARRPKIGR